MMNRVLHRTPDAAVGTLQPSRIDRLRTVARLLDNAVGIPGTRFRFGLDALIGLVPGIGDAAGAILSTFIVWQAARLGAPKSTLARMLGNIGLDAIVGQVPLLGDLFDFGWKANTKNLNLLEEHLRRPAAGRAASRRTLLLLGVGLLALFLALIVLGVVVANFLLELAK
jgi:hypothetical protein